MITLKDKAYYKCENNYIFVYPTLEIVTKMPLVSGIQSKETVERAVLTTKSLSKEFDCQVRYIAPKTIFFTVKTEKLNEHTYLFCLFPEFSGWVKHYSWMDLEELKSEEA